MAGKSLRFLILTTLLCSSTSHGFGISVPGRFGVYGEPIHETISIEAVKQSGFLTDEQSHLLKHLLEGVRFNDSPNGEFIDGTDASSTLFPVIDFALKFVGINKGQAIHDPTKASHFGNYQYMHAMGWEGSDRAEIRGKIDRFIYHCWRMATEPNSYDNLVKDYEAVVKADENFKYTSNQIILRKTIQLFPKNVVFLHANHQDELKYRAIGTILHVIQDSYAKGHTVRVGWEAGDNSGAIRYFQNYSEQDSHSHAEFDNTRHHAVGVFEISGAQAALKRSVQFLNLLKSGCPWTRPLLDKEAVCPTSVYGFARDEVFAFDSSDEGKTRSHPDLVPKIIDNTFSDSKP